MTRSIGVLDRFQDADDLVDFLMLHRGVKSQAVIGPEGAADFEPVFLAVTEPTTASRFSSLNHCPPGSNSKGFPEEFRNASRTIREVPKIR